MALLRLQLLGAPLVWAGDQPLHFATRKSLALLIYLALEPALHPREKLIALLWPERDGKSGRQVLRTTLSYLRRALASGGSAGALQIVQDSVGLRRLAGERAAVTIDVERLLAASGAEAGAILGTLRGDFLEGFALPDAPAFDDWARQIGARCARQIDRLYDELCAELIARRQTAPAAETAARWIAQNPLNETAYQRLMQAHLLAGNRALALAAFERCRQTLATELGVEPGPALQALRLAPAQSSASHPLLQGRSPTPFVGRSDEHRQLAGCLRLAIGGQAQIAMIEGEAGIGKTRLAHEFGGWAMLEGVELLQGQAVEAGGRLPYQPLIDALRPLLERENAPEDLLADVWLAELSRLLPELRERYPDLTPLSGDDALARSRLFEATARLLQRLSERRPLLLLIDDAQWADLATLDLLSYLAAGWQRTATALMLLLTVRSEALSGDSAINRRLAVLGGGQPPLRLRLSALTAAETNQFVQQMADGDQADADRFAGWLFAETAGQPLFMVESVKALQEQGLLAVDERSERLRLSAESLPPLTVEMLPGIRRLIVGRLQRLPPNAQQLLAALAVVGRAASFERMCSVAALDESAGLAALDALLPTRLLLLLEAGAERGALTFSHAKIRDIVYTEAGDVRRRVYHRRLLQRLEQESTPAAELAHHAVHARLQAEALRYTVAAGDAAMALFAVGDAVTHYEQARRLLALEDQPLADADEQHLYAQLARAYELLSQNGPAERICHEMLARAERFGRPDMACAALNRLASLAIYSHRLDQAQAQLLQAQRYAAAGSITSQALTAWGLAQLAHHRGELQRSKGHALRALALARAGERDDLIAGTLNTVGHAQWMLGDVAAAEQTMVEALGRLQLLGNRALEADTLVGLAYSRLLAGKTALGSEAAEAAYRIGVQIDNAFCKTMSRASLVLGLIDQGRVVAALTLARQNVADSRPYGGAQLVAAAFSLGHVYLACGRADEARAAYKACEAVVVEGAVPNFQAQLYGGYCGAAVCAGDWGRALTAAEQSLQFQQYAAVPLIYLPLWPLTQALLAHKRLAAARADVATWRPLLAGAVRYLPLLHHVDGLIAAAEGEIELARRQLDEGLAVAERLDLKSEQWPILLQLAELAADGQQAAIYRARAEAVRGALVAAIGAEQAQLPV